MGVPEILIRVKFDKLMELLLNSSKYSKLGGLWWEQMSLGVFSSRFARVIIKNCIHFFQFL